MSLIMIDILISVGGISVLILPFIIGHFVNKKEQEYKKTNRWLLEQKYSKGDILLAQQGFGPEELLEEFFYNQKES